VPIVAQGVGLIAQRAPYGAEINSSTVIVLVRSVHPQKAFLMAEPVHIVIIDDNAGSVEMLSVALRQTGVSIHTACDSAEGLEIVRRVRPRLVITDLVMPKFSGLDVLDQVMSFDPSIDVLLMTAHYTTETAVESIRRGAADYLQKPVKIVALRTRVAELIAAAELRRKACSPENSDSDIYEFEGLIAKSSIMWELLGMVQRIAPHYRSVLIQGPTGVGKDLVARALHRRSGVKGQFVVLNCSAVVETLFESELFGHVKGAFTGADRDQVGLFEAADGGTLFLDEIGDMPLSTQAKLLRAVQNQEVLPVGSQRYRKVNVRLIAATHRDLRAAILDGTFREDLYYRLAMVELNVPSLKERPEDIPLLVRHFLRAFASEYGKQIEGLTPRALIVLGRYEWPGNVRELEHVVGRACMLTENPIIDVQDLPSHLTESAALSGPDSPAVSPVLSEQERMLVVRALADARGNQSEAAKRLGIGRDALRYKMKKYQVPS
jgi:DNA-binding NtrC family response regulator